MDWKRTTRVFLWLIFLASVSVTGWVIIIFLGITIWNTL